MGYSQSIREEERQITFEEECQGVCKDDSSSTVTHVCPHHQLQVLLCFVGHLQWKHQSAEHPKVFFIPHVLFLALESFCWPSHYKSYCCCSSFEQDPFLSCGKLKAQGKAETCSFLSRLIGCFLSKCREEDTEVRQPPGSAFRHHKAHPSMQMQGER